MPQQDDRRWELLQILDTATDASLQEDLAFLVNASQEELFNYVREESPEDLGYTVKDALDVMIAWLAKKNIIDEKIQYYAIKNTCAALYFKRNPELSDKDKNKLIQDLSLLYESLKTPNSFLAEERAKFLAVVQTVNKVAAVSSSYRLFVYAGLFAAPYVLIPLMRQLTGEEMTSEDWAMCRSYANRALIVGGVGMFAGYALDKVGIFNRAKPTQNQYVAPPPEHDAVRLM